MSRVLYALLVGINNYPASVPNLYGCLNDISAFEVYLNERIASGTFQIRVRTLKNDEAKREAVIAGFREHLLQAGPDDVALFYFSGHGSQEPSPPEFWPFEPDHSDETLVCWDSREPDGWDLADKELAKLIAEVATNGPHVVVVLDCCHSGSGTREALLETAVRRIPTDTRLRPLDTFIFSGEEVSTLRAAPDPDVNPSGWIALPNGRHILLAACRDSETAKEYHADGKQWGAFSYFLRTTLERASGNLTYRDLFQETRARILTHVITQTPQFEALQTTDFDQSFLGGAIAPRPQYFTIRHNGITWVMDGGAVYGLPQSLEDETIGLAFFPFDAPTEDMRYLSKAIGQAEVVEVMPQVSKVKILSPENLDPSLTYKAVITSLPLPPLGISLDGDQDGVELARDAIAHCGSKSGPSLYVREEKTEAQFRLLAQNDEYLITRPADERPLVAQIAGYTAENAALAIRRLEHIARWTKTAELTHFGSRFPANAVKISVLHDGDETNEAALLLEYRYVDGKWQQPTYMVKLKNRSDERLYCAVLGLWESFAIEASYFPTGGIWLEAGQEVNTSLKYASVPKELWQAGVTERRDILKVIICNAEFDATILAQPDLDAPRLETRAAHGFERKSTLNRLFNRLQTREAGDKPEDEVYDDWMTTRIVMTIRRPREVLPVPRIGQPVSLGAGVTLAPHPRLEAHVRLSTLIQASRDLGNLLLPPILRENPEITQPVYFSVSRGGDPGLNVLEFSQIEDHMVVTRANPLRLGIATPLRPGEHILPLGFDGEFFLPLGSAQVEGGQTIVVLDRLPAPVARGTRDLRGSIRILFQKIVGQPLGLPYQYPILAATIVDKDGKVTYEKDSAKVAKQVAKADKISLYIHGIYGDTRSMAASSRFYSAGDLILTFDYENINTPIESIARSLKSRLESVGLRAGHGKRLHLIAHSLGGLVSRWFIEREGGDQIVQHLVLLGTPSAGSPWATVQEWATVGLGLGLNGLAITAWPAIVLSGLLTWFEKIDVTMDQFQPGSDFLKDLAESPDPHVPYTLIAGNVSLKPQANVNRLLEHLSLKNVAERLTQLAFFGYPNDIAVSVHSMKSIGANRQPPLKVSEVGCDHMTYFISQPGVKALAATFL